MTGAALPIFVLFAAIGLFGAVMMVTRTRPVHSALYLVLTLFAVAAIYVLLNAEFLAAVQVLVYAGGIMVLFLFVIFLVRPPAPGEAVWRKNRHLLVSVILAALLAGGLGVQLLSRPPAGAGDRAVIVAATGERGNIQQLSVTLFRHYILPFETVSILLLAAMLGAIVLAGKSESS